MRSVVIAKGDAAWFVIDPTYGISVLFSADLKRECVSYCKAKGWEVRPGTYEW